MEKNNSNEHIYKIYVYTNKVNNKKYVGQTRKSLKERAGNNGRCYNRSPDFGMRFKSMVGIIFRQKYYTII